MVTLFQNILFLQEFRARNGCFEIFSKTKKGSGTSFWCTLSTWCFHESVPYTLSKEKVSMSYLFSFSIYQTKCVTKFLFRQLMTSESLRFIFEQTLKQWLTGRKRDEEKNKKIWISRERKELFSLNKKTFFIVFEVLSFGEK